jgi:hypothetical protein
MAFSNAENERQSLEYKMTMNEHSGYVDLTKTPAMRTNQKIIFGNIMKIKSLRMLKIM